MDECSKNIYRGNLRPFYGNYCGNIAF